ncbi:hypothetical protein STTU_5965 [Streptomyces sp. Tu6071]|nr:hypothetical protein STTU_5965 [Streptomyces sp. Tu6071]
MRFRGVRVEAVVAVELEFLLRREVAAHAEVGRVLDEGACEGDAQDARDEPARLQGDEGVPAEEAGAYRRPLGDSGGVVEVHLVHGADPGTLVVHRLATDQGVRVDIGLHGTSWCRRPRCGAVGLVPLRKGTSAPAATRRPAAPDPPGAPLVRWPLAADPVRESAPELDTGDAEGANPPRNLSGPCTARVRSLWKAGRVRRVRGASVLTDGASLRGRVRP